MFERPKLGTRAVLVHIDISHTADQENLEEFTELVSSAGAENIALVRGKRARPDARFYIGQGKVAEITQAVAEHKAELVIFNHSLTPAQERNLEQAFQCRVLDRTGLILDIFAQRAQTFEGKLQVELAQLRHLSTRLVRGWTHLERQKGGIGLRGPGETQLETDRRLIGGRIKALNKRLDKVCQQRDLRRQGRRKSDVKTISLVGYTNTGKSTLFNYLTGAGVYAADQLFATLDPTLRRLELPAVGPVVLVDTVGFVRHLPHGLVAAFRATLEESAAADLLLHVIDAHDDERHDCIRQVNDVLQEIDADKVMQIEVYNKIDLLEDGKPRIDRDEQGRVRRVWLSAKTGDGLDLLQQAIAERLLPPGHTLKPDEISIPKVTRRLRLLPSAAKLRARLFEWQVVVKETTNDQGEWLVDVAISPGLLGYLQEQKGCFISK